MPHYRIQRTLPNGWNIRLELLPYDTDLGGTITTLGDVCLLELGEQSAEFDGLPYGLVKPQTLKFKLAWDLLPSAVRDYIEDSVDPSNTAKCNLWMLYSDRGTSGATYTLEYAGVEDNVEAVNLEPLDEGNYAYSVELVDMLFHAMKTKTGYSVFNGKSGGLPIDGSQFAFQFLLRSLLGRNQFHEAPGKIKADTLSAIVGHIRSEMSTHIKTNYARTASAATDVFDFSSAVTDLFTASIELYTLTNLNTDPRTISTAITATTGYLVTNIYNESWGGTTIGGIYAPGDNYGWGRRDVTIYDILRDLCEAFGVKASYEFVKRTTAGVERITATWYVKRIASSRDYANNVDTADVTLSIDDALSHPSIVKRGDNIAKAEVRYETSNSEDSTEIVRLKNGARSSRSFNVEPIIHNIPVYLRDYDDQWGRREPMKQTNQIYFKASDNNTIVKVHETTKYWYGPKTDQWIKVSSTASNKPEYQDEESQDKYRVQLAAMQGQTSMTAALCVLHLHVFADENNATAELDWNYTKSQFVRPEGLCGRHVLTDDAADKFAQINWNYALPTSITMDWFAGTSKVKYYVLAPVTSKETT